MKSSLIILAGGNSTRFGFSKYIISLKGKPLIEYPLDSLSSLFEETIIIENLNLLKDLKKKYPEVKIFKDIIPPKGPITGLLSGLFYSKYEKNFLIGADMPFLSIDLVKYILKISKDKDIVMPKITLNKSSFIEPLFALYSKKVIPFIENLINNGQFAIRSMLSIPDLKIYYLENHEIEKFDKNFLSFFNINTPSDLKAAEGILEKEREYLWNKP